MPLNSAHLIGLVGAAFAGGLVDAIAGGGGLVTLPALLAAGLGPQAAIATNKGQAVFGAMGSAATFWRRGAIDRARAGWTFALGLIGSALGALALLAMPGPKLGPIVAVLLAGAALFMLMPKRLRPSGAAPRHRIARSAAIALVLGGYDGFFGPGVGTLLIVAFAAFCHDALDRASANAKVVNLASNIAAFAIFVAAGRIQFSVALPMAIGNALGATVGARLTVARGAALVRIVVFVVALATAVKLVFDMIGA